MQRNAKNCKELRTNANDLTSQQEIVIAAILDGKTQTDAAEEAGVNPVTVSRWKATDPAFMAELNRRQRDLWDENYASLLALAADARRVLADLVHAKDPQIRFKAALAVLDRLPEQRPAGPVTARAAALEQATDEPSAIDVMLAEL